MELPASFGAWVRLLRKSADITQDELARRVGCSLSAIRKIETDQRRPSRQVALLLARALGIPAPREVEFIKVARGERRTELFASIESGTPLSASTIGKKIYSPPLPALPIIGRGPELSQVIHLLGSDNCRLLTILGPGGIGKSRLAIEAGQYLRSQYPLGVLFVPLAEIDSANLIPSAVGKAAGMRILGNEQAETQVLSFLEEQKCLLILDNLEHLSAGYGFLQHLLANAPGIKLLVTSQQRLGIAGEWTLELYGLPIPPARPEGSIEDYSAVRLFVERARLSQPGFVLKASDRPWVSKICQMTEGMPLALELAASWVRLLTCQEIAEEISQSLDFLTSSASGINERHRSMRAVFDRTWQIMLPEDRIVFSRLTVFRGGFSRQAAEHVAGARLSMLSRLSDQSMIYRSSEGHYGIHEILRQFGLEKLKDDAHSFSETRSKHSAYFAAWVASMEERIHGREQIAALDEISIEMDNLQMAWDWAISHSAYAEIQQLLTSMGWYYELRGQVSEGEDFYQRALDLFCVSKSGDCFPLDEEKGVDYLVTLARLITYRGMFRFRAGNNLEARNDFIQSQRLLTPFHHPIAQAEDLRGLALTYLQSGDSLLVREKCIESIQIGEQANYVLNTALCTLILGMVDTFEHNLLSAEKYFQRALAHLRHMEDIRGVALGLSYLGSVYIEMDRLLDARQALQESLEWSSYSNEPYLKANIYLRMGLLSAREQDFRSAEKFFTTSIRQLEMTRDDWSLTYALQNLGYSEIEQGKTDEAENTFRRALRISMEKNFPLNMLDALVGLAACQWALGNMQLASEWACAIGKHPAANATLSERIERYCSACLDVFLESMNLENDPDEGVNAVANLVAQILRTRRSGNKAHSRISMDS